MSAGPERTEGPDHFSQVSTDKASERIDLANYVKLSRLKPLIQFFFRSVVKTSLPTVSFDEPADALVLQWVQYRTARDISVMIRHLFG